MRVSLYLSFFIYIYIYICMKYLLHNHYRQCCPCEFHCNFNISFAQSKIAGSIANGFGIKFLWKEAFESIRVIWNFAMPLVIFLSSMFYSAFIVLCVRKHFAPGGMSLGNSGAQAPVRFISEKNSRFQQRLPYQYLNTNEFRWRPTASCLFASNHIFSCF